MGSIWEFSLKLTTRFSHPKQNIEIGILMKLKISSIKITGRNQLFLKRNLTKKKNQFWQ